MLIVRVELIATMMNIDKSQLNNLIKGASVLSTGGGGPVVKALGQVKSLRKKFAVEVIEVSKLPKEALIQVSEILQIPGVVGIGIGLSPDGKDLVFVVYCEKVTEQVRKEIPDSIEGVPVQLVESGTFKAH